MHIRNFLLLICLRLIWLLLQPGEFRKVGGKLFFPPPNIFTRSVFLISNLIGQEIANQIGLTKSVSIIPNISMSQTRNILHWETCLKLYSAFIKSRFRRTMLSPFLKNVRKSFLRDRTEENVLSTNSSVSELSTFHFFITRNHSAKYFSSLTTENISLGETSALRLWKPKGCRIDSLPGSWSFFFFFFFFNIVTLFHVTFPLPRISIFWE